MRVIWIYKYASVCESAEERMGEEGLLAMLRNKRFFPILRGCFGSRESLYIRMVQKAERSRWDARIAESYMRCFLTLYDFSNKVVSVIRQSVSIATPNHTRYAF
ncbi:hypothetical protein AVEN_258091-1 [Araneus ventricosus]|uniref:Uncharacterized protein n=1 Tax=Araneus ventricosus TaxID=182803 RepID=A0A4Y2QJ59_ARAVE|nr:hypothetical protein AVEN_258091-1 [Araneus ventricosus]